MIFDFRMVNGPAEIVVGALLLTIALRMYFLSDSKRIKRLQGFVNERGFSAIMAARPLGLTLGGFFVSTGIASARFWFGDRNVAEPTVAFFGGIGSACLLIAAGLSLMVGWRLFRLKP